MSTFPARRDVLRTAAESVVVGVVYYVTARASVHLAIPHTGDTPVWPPSGIAVAALVLRGRRLLPGLAGASFLLNATIGTPVLVSAGIAIGNVAEYAAATAVLRRWDYSASFARLRDVATLVVGAAVAAPVVAAVVGPACEWAGGVVPVHRLPDLIFTWWVGDGVGILIVAPTVHFVVECWRRRNGGVARPVELGVLLLLFGGAAAAVFAEDLPAKYLLFIAGVLVAKRAGTAGALGASAVLWAAALTTAVDRVGTFASGTPNGRFLELESLAASFTVMVYVLAATSNARLRSEERVRLDEVELAAQADTVRRVEEDADRLRVRAEEEHDRLQAQLHRARRLESLGQLSGGIAHDFNNLLAVVINYATVVEKKVSGLADDLSREERRGAAEQIIFDARAIRSAAGRGARLTRQLLAFARQERMAPVEFDLASVVSEVGELLRRTLGDNISVTIVNATPSVTAVADPAQVEQVLLNLALNARDAMADGGHLSLRCDVHTVGPSGEPAWPDLSPGRFARLVVTDTGTGMEPEVLERVFDPFFTTKPSGEGTGLGLATVYGIVVNSGGEVHIDSTPGRGTAVTVLLPASAPDSVRGAGRRTQSPGADPRRPAPASIRAPSEPARVATPPGGSAPTVLVVEDQPDLLVVTGRLLADAGWEVISAHDGVEAVEIARGYSGDIDVLVTDVVMPGASGWQVAEEVTSCRPGVRVLYISGYEGGAPDAKRAPGDVIQKPFLPEELIARAQALLG